jgi:hypothetical protein
MQMNILETLDELESCHQELKKEYLEWAKGKQGLFHNGIGAENNPATTEFLRTDSAMVKEINTRLDIVKEAIRNNDCQNRYEILREIYVIHPSFHELWFFDWHFNHLTSAGKILNGRLGLKAYLTCLNGKRLDKTRKGISTFTLKRTILLENLFSGVLDCSLFDVDPLSDEQLKIAIEGLKSDLEKRVESKKDPLYLAEDIQSKMPVIFEICRTLLERTNFDALKTDKLLSYNGWLCYAPCNINEGPIFKKNSEKSRVDILKGIKSINQNEIRSELCKHFEITPMLGE